MTDPFVAATEPAAKVRGSPSTSDPDRVPVNAVFCETLILVEMAVGVVLDAVPTSTETMASALLTVPSFTLNEKESLPVKPVSGV